MRDSKRGIWKTVFCAGMTVCIWLSGTGHTSWASSVNRVEQEKAAAAARQEQAEAKGRELEAQKQTAQEGIENLGAELKKLLIETDILENDINDMKLRITEAQNEYRAADQNRQSQYEILKNRIRYIYEEGDITYLDILLKAKSMGDVLSQSEYFRQLYEYDRKLISDYEKLCNDALYKKQVLEEHKSELESMNQEYTTRQRELSSVIDSKKKEVEDFEIQLTAAREEAAKEAETVRVKSEELRRLRTEAEAARQRTEEEAGRSPAMKQAGQPVKSTGGTEFGRNVADYALQFIGNPYSWGGTSLTSGADCSGFTQSVYRHFGVSIPRTSGEQAHFGKEIAYEDMEPGDLICYVGHVSMYIGDGRIVHASSKKSGIKVDYNPAYRTIVSIRRPWQ